MISDPARESWCCSSRAPPRLLDGEAPPPLPPCHSARPASAGLFSAAEFFVFGATASLAPRVDRHSLAISRTHDPPVAVGLAADHDHVDLALGEMVDQLDRKS